MAMQYRPVDRDQLFLMPVSMRDWLPEGHLALLVEDVITQMDTSALHAQARLGGAGRAGYDPDMLLMLLVYGYADGIRSARKIEARCRTDIAFGYLCAQDVPDHTVIARFRRAHAEVLTDLITEVLVVAVQLGMGRFGHIAIDGTKITASAAKDANRDLATLRRLVEEITQEAIAADDVNDAQHGQHRGDELPPAARARADRHRRITAALARAEALAGDTRPARCQASAQRKLAAAQAALEQARATQQAKVDAYERQYAADGVRPYGAIPAPVATAATVRQAQARLDKAHTRLERTTAACQQDTGGKANLTDPDSRLLPTRGGAFIQGYNCQTSVSDDHLITVVAVHDNPNDTEAFAPMMDATTTVVATVAERTSTTQTVDLVTADCGYDSDDNLTATGPQRIIAQADRRSTEATAREHPTSGPPPEQATARQKMAHQLATAQGHRAYKRRAATVEPVNGHLKDRIGLRQFLLRGTTGATIELTLAAIAHNIRRIHSHLAAQPA
jgi:transposase